MAKTYTLNVAGLTRELTICKVNDHMDIAAFIMLGDAELTVAAATELLKKCPEFDILLTAEAKGIPLAHEMSRQSGKPYICARKGEKLYMADPVVVEDQSITTAGKQKLVIDRKELDKMSGQAGALHPEGGRLPIHRFHPQDRPHPAGEIGRGCALHLRLQQDTAAIVGGLDRIPFCLRGAGQHKAQHCPQDQADAITPGRTFAQTARQRPQQTGNKKCRKRHKTSRLRQKGAH